MELLFEQHSSADENAGPCNHNIDSGFCNRLKMRPSTLLPPARTRCISSSLSWFLACWLSRRLRSLHQTSEDVTWGQLAPETEHFMNPPGTKVLRDTPRGYVSTVQPIQRKLTFTAPASTDGPSSCNDSCRVRHIRRFLLYHPWELHLAAAMHDELRWKHHFSERCCQFGRLHRRLRPVQCCHNVRGLPGRQLQRREPRSCRTVHAVFGCTRSAPRE